MHQRPSAVGMTAGHHEPGSTARHLQPEGLTAPRSRAYVCTTMGPTEGEPSPRIRRKSADRAGSMPIRQARPRSWRLGAVAALAAGRLLTWLSSAPARARAGRTHGTAAAMRATRSSKPRQSPAQAGPVIDPNFIYGQLAFMATRFQQREAGYRADASGHAGFADYWTTEMLRLLSPFGATARRYPFRVPGWAGRPATAPAVNVEITVPGVRQPAQVVVIGCHYDGEASSTQSAFDDASGCAIELGVAQAMAESWRSPGLYPARTLRFVVFDAEEEGIVGSFNYVNEAANGSVPDIVAMFNE